MKSIREITAWDPPIQYGWEGHSGPSAVDMTATFAEQEDPTEIGFSVNVKKVDLASGRSMFGKQLKHQIKNDLASLKRVMEGGTK